MAPAIHSPSRLRILSATIPCRRSGASVGHAQLSLVEHALCPLDPSASLGGPYVHDSRYWFTDQNRHRKEARVHIACPDGLSPSDEFYLWGLLSLTFSQAKPTPDFFATPYYCLRHLECIDPEGHSGGKNYALFRSAISRLSTVSYRNDHFYDPIRGEHRSVGFGFLSYSLPLDPASSRAWRIAWDPIFFEFCAAAAGALHSTSQSTAHLIRPPVASTSCSASFSGVWMSRRLSTCGNSPSRHSASLPAMRTQN